MLRKIFITTFIFLNSAFNCVNAQDMSVLKVKITKESLVTIPVFINGRGPYKFLLDLGSDSTQIEKTLFKELGIVSTTTVVLSTINGDIRSAVGFARIKVGEYEETIEVVATDLNNEKFFTDYKINGVLGVNAFQYLGLAFDKKKSLVFLFKNPKEQNGIKINALGKLRTVVVKISNEEKKLLIDTGTNKPIIFSSNRDLENDVYALTVNGETKIRAKSMKIKFSLGNLEKEEEFFIINKSGLPYDGLLPIQTLDFFYFDGKNNILSVDKQSLIVFSGK